MKGIIHIFQLTVLTSLLEEFFFFVVFISVIFNVNKIEINQKEARSRACKSSKYENYKITAINPHPATSEANKTSCTCFYFIPLISWIFFCLLLQIYTIVTESRAQSPWPTVTCFFKEPLNTAPVSVMYIFHITHLGFIVIAQKWQLYVEKD